MNKKTVLFYGDSNTYGTKPISILGESERYTEEERWVGIIRQALKEDYYIIEEGLPSRTTVHDDPIEGIHKNGLTYLRPCLESHFPIDIIVLMLGTNDLKARFSVTAVDIANSIDRLILEIASCTNIKGYIPPKIILLCPAPIHEIGIIGRFFEGGAKKSRGFAVYYQEIAEKHHIAFLDIGSVVEVSQIDGIHFDQDQQAKLAKAVQSIIENL